MSRSGTWWRRWTASPSWTPPARPSPGWRGWRTGSGPPWPAWAARPWPRPPRRGRGQGLGHALQRPLGRLDPDEPLAYPGRDHQRGAEQVAVEDVDLLAGLDQLAEQGR